MDLIYMTDALAYQTIRGPLYERYEYQWSKPNQEKSEKTSVPEGHSSHDKCKICKEKQRRSLATYIRKKSTGCSGKIIEEEEECQQG